MLVLDCFAGCCERYTDGNHELSREGREELLLLLLQTGAERCIAAVEGKSANRHGDAAEWVCVLGHGEGLCGELQDNEVGPMRRMHECWSSLDVQENAVYGEVLLQMRPKGRIAAVDKKWEIVVAIPQSGSA
jgi:hypothetical protein